MEDLRKELAKKSNVLFKVAIPLILAIGLYLAALLVARLKETRLPWQVDFIFSILSLIAFFALSLGELFDYLAKHS